MERMDFTAFFQEKLPFWRKLSEEDQKRLCLHSSVKMYQKGEMIHDSTDCAGVIFVRSGSLRLYIMSEEGREVTLYRLLPGDMCMLSASCVLQCLTFDVFVQADIKSECIVIAGPIFASLSEKNPDMKIFALETAVSRFSDVMWVMQQVLFMSMDRRLALFLYDETVRTGTPVIALTQEQIAGYIGSAREVVSRMLKYFASEGLVEVARKGITVLDKQRLRKLAGG